MKVLKTAELHKKVAIRDDITGNRYGRLVVIGLSHSNKNSRNFWKVKCDCGNESVVSGPALKSGRTQSCGCLWKESISTHNMSRTKIYRVWIGIKSRCFNPKSTKYDRYGGRGISICDEWESFQNFYSDVGDIPFDGAQIDRIDNDGNYEPSNVRWVTMLENNRNTSRNIFLTFMGATKTVSEWAEYLQVNVNTIYGRLYKGWSVEDTLAKPVKAIFRNKNARRA